MKILVADDNVQGRYLLMQLFTASGHQCTAVADGAAALGALRSEPFDAIVSDILMPGMDGFQFCRETRNDPQLGALPFVFYTATYTDEKDREFGLSLGADAFLIKPSDPSVLLEAIERARGDKARRPSLAPGPAEQVFLQQYNSRLVHKLESKLSELERSHSELLKTNLALGHEVSRRASAERTERSIHVLLRATLESTADGLVAFDASGRVLVANPHFIELWKLDARGEATQRVPALLAAVRSQTVDPIAIENLFSLGAGADDPGAEGALELNDERWVEYRARPLHLEGTAAGRVISFSDISARRKTEREQRALTQQLFQSQKMEALGILAGGIAHDFNNLLTAILGNTSLLRGEFPGSHPALEYLGTIEQASAQASELVAQILAFSRNQPPRPELVELSSVIRAATKLLEALVPPDIELKFSLEPNVPPIRADVVQLQQILLNLGSNAVHAMSAGGTLEIGVRRSSLSTAQSEKTTTLAAGEYTVLSVADTGTGMDEALQRRIFEPFFTTKAQGKGTGLGLSVVHGIVKSFGGGIVIHSEVGRGTRFELYFPVTEEAAPTSEQRPAKTRQGHGERVLLVEDDASVRLSLRRMLERCGYQVDAHETPKGAIEAFRGASERPALAVLDFSMPDMTGAELARVLRVFEPKLPIVIVTGYLSPDDLKQDPGALKYELLLKPCSTAALSETLARALEALNAQE